MTPRQRRFDRMVGLVSLAALVVGILLVLRPFLSAVLWAIVLTYSTWPVFARVRQSVRGQSGIAAALMTVLLTFVIILPVTIVVLSLGESIAPVYDSLRRWLAAGLPAPPPWLAQLPLIGETAQAYWLSLAGDTSRLVADLLRLVEPLKSQLVSGGLQIGQGLLSLVLSVVLAFFFYRDGDAAASAYSHALARIAGPRAARLTAVAGGTIRSVVYGILGTALAQAILAVIGLTIAGVPGAPLWGTLTFFLSVVPVGPPIVWIGATVWLVTEGSLGWAAFMGLWGMFVISGVDNIIKPYLISRGSRLPFILTLLGVLGGVLAFGFIGVFLGPTLLAVGYRLLQEWVAEPALPEEAASGGRESRSAARDRVAEEESAE
jgi:predicted PurR-regulated permease PerM